MRNIDELLQEALSPTEEMSDELKRRVCMQVRERKEHNMRNIRKLVDRKRSISAAAIAAAVLLATSATAFAAWQYLSARDVAMEANDMKLAEAFSGDEAIAGGEVQSSGGYDISFLGLVSGENISNDLPEASGGIVNDKTYAVVGIAKSDGTPMADPGDEAYLDQEILVSPYIKGYDPNKYNVFTLGGGGYTGVVRNGVWYRIMEVNNIEPFADHTIYLGVTDRGPFFNPDAYLFDEMTGVIRPNDAYDGVHALFTIPIDPSKANADAANAILEAIDHPAEDEDTETCSDPSSAAEAEKFMADVTPENIDTYASPMEETRQTITPDEKGNYTYRYEFPDGASGGSTNNVDEVFPDGKMGMSKTFFSWCEGEDGLSSLRIETHTLNEDGTVTCVIYQPNMD